MGQKRPKCVSKSEGKKGRVRRTTLFVVAVIQWQTQAKPYNYGQSDQKRIPERFAGTMGYHRTERFAVER